MKLREKPFENSATYHEWLTHAEFLSLGQGLEGIFDEEAIYGKLIQTHSWFRPDLWKKYAEILSRILTKAYVAGPQAKWLEKLTKEEQLLILRGGVRRRD